MRKLVAAVDFGAGLLLLGIPRYVFQPCGWTGRPAMHCSATAVAEMVLGALLLLAGAFALAAKGPRRAQAATWASCLLVLLAGFAPSVYGYCASPKMACHYGMAPAVRFVAAVAGVLLVAGMALARGGVGKEAPSA